MCLSVSVYLGKSVGRLRKRLCQVSISSERERGGGRGREKEGGTMKETRDRRTEVRTEH